MTKSSLEDTFAHLLHPEVEVDKSELDFFHINPWSQKWLKDQQYTAFTITSRVPKTTRADDVFARTLNTTSTLSHWLYIVNKAILTPDAIERNPPGPDEPDTILFVHLELGVSGFRDTTHGGVLCALLDEVQSTAVEVRRRIQSSDLDTLYTANLSVDFCRSVPTPGLAMVKAWVESRQGRKWRARGVIVDGEGRVCVESSSLWVAARKQKI